MSSEVVNGEEGGYNSSDRSSELSLAEEVGDNLSDISSELSTNRNFNDDVERSQKGKGENSESSRINLQQRVLNVAPLNCIPYNGPPNATDTSSLPTQDKAAAEAAETIGPAIIYLPPNATREELDNIMAVTKTGIAYTGALVKDMLGPVVGLMDMGELPDSYYFRVNLPGVSMDKKDFNCDIQPDGSVRLRGVSLTGEKIVCKNFQIFHMVTQNLCPPGEFTVSLQLPGPVKPQEVTTLFEGGIFEAIVKKA
ncbi:hypothetical protein CCACVL1_22805 [Corchorus capsularis]|uniref:SHSP domain-containing protein n=1 Tax=Corchorus capsularis TaxID=210143 RepID=A0A1R3GWG5_COCAP|nr:hypothetical protein CCACVL1_22805 [Corchorus capsularis]